MAAPLLAVALALPCAAAAETAPQAAPAPWWHLLTTTTPTALTPGDKADLVVGEAVNVGDATASGSFTPITLSVALPSWLRVVGVKLVEKENWEAGTPCPLPAAGEPATCEYSGSSLPFQTLYEQVSVEVPVQGAPGGSAGEAIFSVGGGNTQEVATSAKLSVGGPTQPLGITNYELIPEAEGGADAGTPLDTQAGSHPFQLTTALSLSRRFFHTNTIKRDVPAPTALPKEVRFNWPAGMIGDVVGVPQCSQRDFFTITEENTNLCDGDTAVGVAVLTLSEPKTTAVYTEAVPLFNLEPSPGEPAKLGFETNKVPVTIDTGIRTGEGYGVRVEVRETSQSIGLLDSVVTVWGVPGDEAHQPSRGWECIDGGRKREAFEPPRECGSTTEAHPAPLLTLPSSCGPFASTAEVNTWEDPATFASREYALAEQSGRQVGLGGCGEIPFAPSLSTSLDSPAASTPTGVTVGVHVPQQVSANAEGIAESDLRDATVTLPAGLQINPGDANGLVGCTMAEIALESPGPGACPAQAKLGTVTVRTPDLPEPLEGYVYAASPQNFAAPPLENPFGSLFAIYISAESPRYGTVVKLAGEVRLDEATGQVQTTFRDSPQLPFEDFDVHFFDGGRAPLSAPAFCGPYATRAAFSPWSEGEGGPGTVAAEAPFDVTTGPAGSPCPGATRPFTPSVTAGSNGEAGGFTPFTTTVGNPDGDQPLAGLVLHLPPGLTGLLSAVTPCPAPSAAAGACASSSQIGESMSYSGLGGEPYALPGTVYLTGPYEGAPFGLAVVTPAVAGPYDLGTVVVLSRLEVDPRTAAVTVTSDPFPTFVRGVPVQLKDLVVTVDRAGSQVDHFQINPTNCSPLAVTGVVLGGEGGSSPVSQPFAVGNCATLPFDPRLTATVGGRASRVDGAQFTVKITSPGIGQANIHKVELQLPKALPSRLSTLQKACLAAVFEAAPSKCSRESVIGSATVHTPLLRSPLTGPAYLVSHGDAAFPDVEFVLQGEGITLVLDGKTDIKKGITYSRFETAPDAPITSFETVFPAGPHSVLGAYVPASQRYSLCHADLAMPTTIVGQNGATIKTTTKIAPSGCKAAVRRAPLARALAGCRKIRASAKRAHCARLARRRYARGAASRTGAGKP